jgi:hypothetical protein
MTKTNYELRRLPIKKPLRSLRKTFANFAVKNQLQITKFIDLST